ncbi:hypothetical protein LUZ60_012048 [Juncus effusus]|nr:hypothetical protein LUZ60_012048 [Juncus effusus]
MNNNYSSSSHTEALFRILCPTDRLQPVTRIAIAGARIRIDSSSSAPHNSSDRVIAISPSDSSPPKSRDDFEFDSLTPAQCALVRVFERILFNEGGEKDIKEREMVVCKLLAPNSQVGCILGKGGKIVERMRHESGAQIRVFGKEQSFSIANSVDELIHVSGSFPAVKKALILISACLQDHHPVLFSPRAFLSEQEILFRLLCPHEKVRGIIGKGGATVRGLQSETGACIKVLDPVYEAEEKIIVISAFENSEMRQSPSQQALLLIHSKLSENVNGIFSDPSSDSSARLLLPAQQMGCLVGKGGAFLQEIKRNTGADLRIFYGEQMPRCAHPNDELLQIIGGVQSVHEALIQITGRIRETIFPKKMSPNLDNNKNNKSHVGPTNITTQQLNNNSSGNSVISGENKGFNTPIKMEINIPCEYLAFVNGDNGSDLFEIIQISGANITIEDLKTGRVVIYGNSEQTKTAQSLIHGLIYCGVFNPS